MLLGYWKLKVMSENDNFSFQSLGTLGNRYFRNTAMRTGNCVLLLHWEQHKIFSVSCELLNNIKSDCLLEGTFWKRNMILFSSARQPKVLDTRSAPQKLMLLWVLKLFRTSLLFVLRKQLHIPPCERHQTKPMNPSQLSCLPTEGTLGLMVFPATYRRYFTDPVIIACSRSFFGLHHHW